MAKKSSTSVPRRATPNPMLLALVSQYLKNNGFNSAHRIFNTERKKRPKKEGWEGTFGQNYTENFPTLENIFQIWEEEHPIMESSASGEGDDDSSSSESNSSSDSSDSEKAKPSSQESQSESSSDSDSDDAGSATADVNRKPNTVTTVKGGPVAPGASGSTNSLKRKAHDSSSESSGSASTEDDTSGSDDESESEDEVQPTKKQRTTDSSSSSESDENSGSDSGSESGSDSKKAPHTTILSTFETLRTVKKPQEQNSDASSSSDDSSKSESSSESDEGAQDETVLAVGESSDSSGTIVGDINITKSSVLDDRGVDVTKVTVTKKKHIGAQPTRLAALSASSNPRDFISNDYVSYDYADKAYRDLSITRGKGFTKEKNKKKRGSYRGGAIDISGGKGFKFED